MPHAFHPSIPSWGRRRAMNEFKAKLGLECFPDHPGLEWGPALSLPTPKCTEYLRHWRHCCSLLKSQLWRPLVEFSETQTTSCTRLCGVEKEEAVDIPAGQGDRQVFHLSGYLGDVTWNNFLWRFEEGCSVQESHPVRRLSRSIVFQPILGLRSMVLSNRASFHILSYALKWAFTGN